jgi:hypothetical protein
MLMAFLPVAHDHMVVARYGQAERGRGEQVRQLRSLHTGRNHGPRIAAGKVSWHHPLQMVSKALNHP